MRRTRHRRRFHADRIVSDRRARYLREYTWGGTADEELEDVRRFSYGALADRDPWDCGDSCYMCHFDKREPGQRERAERLWRADWGV